MAVRSPARVDSHAKLASKRKAAAKTKTRAKKTKAATPTGAAELAAADAMPPPRVDNAIRVSHRSFPGERKIVEGRNLDVLPDQPDLRDRMYRPHLRALAPAIYPKIAFSVRDQGESLACTGFALAHVIDVMRYREISGENPGPVSARMLYEMAKLNDEWEGTAYKGSSIRGALRGFHRNGVCSEALATDAEAIADVPWVLDYAMAKEARERRLGTYYRLEPDLNDYHAAINEVGAIYASAQIHRNWFKLKDGRFIEPGGAGAGGHAFAIVGYNETGFWVLNSWGTGWGAQGVAHWSYADWAATVMDAWVLQLGVRAPEAFSAVPGRTPASTSGLFGFGAPNRMDVLGHFINIDDGRLQRTGRYASPNDAEMKVTVDRLTSEKSNTSADVTGYDHLVIYAHGGLNSLEDDARRISVWKNNKIFSRNNLYNFHLMWASDFIGEVFGKISESPVAGRAAGPLTDWLFDAGVGKLAGSRAWRNMKQDCRAAFGDDPNFRGGIEGLKPLFAGLNAPAVKRRPKLHLVGHSAGSILLGHLLSALSKFDTSNLELGSIHLMAPACTLEFFLQHYRPYIMGSGAMKLLDKVYLYNLTDALERDDTVSTPRFPFLSYGKSLLYLVSRAYEEKPNTPLAGMEHYLSDPGMPKFPKLDIAYSRRPPVVTESTTHGGFDNDAKTLTTIMSRIAGGTLKHPPVQSELEGY
jgi:hypothetical protein